MRPKLMALRFLANGRMFWVELAFDSSTFLHGKGAFRFCIPNQNTIWNDVKVTLETIESIGREVLASEMDKQKREGF